MEENQKKYISKVYLYLMAFFILAAAIFAFAFSSCMALAFGSVGITIVIGLYYLMRFTAIKHPKETKIFNRILSYAVFLFIMVFAITEGALFVAAAPNEEEPPVSEYIIVLGAENDGMQPSDSMLARLEMALETMNANTGAKCVVSGGTGKGQDVSEAQCMLNWLEKNGVDSGRIIVEDRARNTRENIKYSLELIKEVAGENVDSVSIITSDYHILRSELIAKDSGTTANGITVPTESIVLKVNYYFREAFAMWHYMLAR